MDEDDYRALVEQSHQVRELTKHQGWEILLDYARFGHNGMAKRQEQIIRGASKDYAEYVGMTKMLEGEQRIIDIPDVLDQLVANAAERMNREKE